MRDDQHDLSSAVDAIDHLTQGFTRRNSGMSKGELDALRYVAAVAGVCRGMNNRSKPPLRYTTTEELVMVEGRRFTVPTGPLPAGVPKGKAKQCFANSFRIATNGGKFFYVEGMAVLRCGLPVHHAWLTTDGHDVVDPTWAGRAMQNGDGFLASGYFGIPLTTRFVHQAAAATGHYGVFGSNGSSRAALLWWEALRRDGLPTDAVVTFPPMSLQTIACNAIVPGV